jgi:CubicO group peptidase (beta-lactamase class C family)
VGDYILEMKNPIILERASAGDMSFRPATTAITVQHLMNFTSGLYYPAAPPDAFGLDKGYTSKEMHQAADPVSAFFQTIKVHELLFAYGL